MARKLFCQINPTCYRISMYKEIMLRYIKDFFSSCRIAKDFSGNEFKYLIKSHTSIALRNLHNVDFELQKNKITNLELACAKINGLIIKPGETFSFWRTIGEPTEKKGYKEGLVIIPGGFGKGVGGGLCQLANMIHYLVLNSELEVTELHHHSDALFPDDRRRVPFGTGTSVCFNNIDYRFTNKTNKNYQLLLWVEDSVLCGELRCDVPDKYRYKLVEEDSHFAKEGKKYFRISKVYKITINRKTNKEVKKDLILDNHSEVLYDYDLIPKEEIRND